MAAGQSPEAQAARLAMQCCPVHGGGLGQASAWYSSVTRQTEPNDYSLACCARSDCDVVAKITKAAFEQNGPAIVVTSADVDPDLWREATAWIAHKRARGPK